MKFGSKSGSIVRGKTSVTSSLSPFMKLPSRLNRFWKLLHVEAKLSVVFFWEHRIAGVVIEQSAVWWPEIDCSFDWIAEAQSQYFSNLKLPLLNFVLTPKRLSSESISTLKYKRTEVYSHIILMHNIWIDSRDHF